MKIEHAIHFGFVTANNEVGYKVFLVGTKMATALDATTIKIHTGSQLVVCQIIGEFTPKEDKCPSIRTQGTRNLQRLEGSPVMLE